MARHTADIQELLQKEITRREFLATLGFALLSIFGAGRFLTYLLRDKPVHNPNLMTYGSGSYGANRETR